MTIRRTLVIATILLAAMLAGGCEKEYFELAGAENGLVVILPGIQGIDSHSYSVKNGLKAGGVRGAMVIQSWGKPVPGLGMLLNQIDPFGVRLDAMAIADKIMRYQIEQPGKPVHVIGHSGGGALAVFIAESLADRLYDGADPIDGIVLLSPSISTIYDYTKATRACKNGILNCYNPNDAGLLGVGTTVMGNLDGWHGPAAGMLGFDPPNDLLDGQEKKDAYANKLFQHRFKAYGDAHMSSTNASFIRTVPATFILRGEYRP